MYFLFLLWPVSTPKISPDNLGDNLTDMYIESQLDCPDGVQEVVQFENSMLFIQSTVSWTRHVHELLTLFFADLWFRYFCNAIPDE